MENEESHFSHTACRDLSTHRPQQGMGGGLEGPSRNNSGCTRFVEDGYGRKEKKSGG